MGAITFFTNRTEITGLTHDSTFNDADLSSYISSSAVGVIIEIVNSGTVSYLGRVRCNGSTDDITTAANIDVDSYTVVIAKCDASQVVEIYSENSVLKYYVTGELGAGAILKTNLVNKSTSTTGSWVEVDITADLEAGDSGNVEAAIVTSVGTLNADKEFNVRKKGSTDDYIDDSHGIMSWIVGVDSSDIFEQQISQAAQDCYLVGYIKTDSGLTMKTNYVEKTSLTNDAWTDLDITTDTSATADGVILTITSSSSALKYTRKNSSTNAVADHQYITRMSNFIGLDSSQILEYYGNTASIQIMGYTAPSGATYNATTEGALPAMTGGIAREVIYKRTITGVI